MADGLRAGVGQRAYECGRWHALRAPGSSHNCTNRHLFGGFARSDNTAVHWVFTRDDKMCLLETSYHQEGDCYLVTMHTDNGRTETECFKDADLFNMYLAAIESALDRAGWQPAVPNRPLFMPESAGKRPDSVH